MRREPTRGRWRAPVRRARCLLRPALLGLLGCGAVSSGLAQTGVLFAIPTELQAPHPPAADSPWHLALQATDASVLAKALNLPPPPANTSVVDYTLDGYREIPGSPARTWLEETFVIDYHDRQVAELYAEFLKAQAGRPWARQRLTDFVAAAMSASLGSPFQIASQVAHSRNADCKGYAVLTAALARSAGVPARVAFGLVLLERDGHYAAFGHAWAEVREADHWVVEDAALRDDRGATRYLPFGILDDEGPGFELSVLRLAPVWVQRVTITGTP
jgi:hypothetical protein